MPEVDALRHEFTRQSVMLRRILRHPDFPPGRRQGTSEQAHRFEQVGNGAVDPYRAVSAHHIERAFLSRTGSVSPSADDEVQSLQRAAAYEVSVLEATAASPGFPARERAKLGNQVDELLAAAGLRAKRKT